jgi:hypothetical protein
MIDFLSSVIGTSASPTESRWPPNWVSRTRPPCAPGFATLTLDARPSEDWLGLAGRNCGTCAHPRCWILASTSEIADWAGRPSCSTRCRARERLSAIWLRCSSVGDPRRPVSGGHARPIASPTTRGRLHRVRPGRAVGLGG